MEHAVRVENLVKRFGSLTAVDGVTFSVERGEIFGILGPNGAGKTTTLEIIEGLQTATEGSVEVLGLEVRTRSRQVKSRIGVQLQSSSYYDYLTLSETISLLGSFYPRRVSPRPCWNRWDWRTGPRATIATCPADRNSGSPWRQAWSTHPRS